MLKYKRISLKLSGEAMGGAQAVDFDKAEAIARQVARLHELGAEIGITIGGGNIWRGRSSGDMDRNRADQMGMLATVINSLAVQDCLLKLGIPAVVMSSIDMPRIADSYSSRAAHAALDAGKVVIQRVLDYANAAENWHIAPDNREGVRISFDLDGGMDNGWFLLRLSVHDPVLPLNVESDVPGGVRQMLESLLKVLNDAEGIDLTPLKKAVEEA